MAGDEMRYDFSEISNTSNIPLSDFYWHAQLPAEAVRLKTIFTGTWNESLTYSVVYKTNLKSGYKTLAANLSSKTSHTLDCSPAALKLAAGEYVTDIRFDFGTVKAGFKEDTAPSFVVTTLATLPDGHRIVNHTDVSGTTGGKTVTAKDTWITVALGKPKGCLPRTGYSEKTENSASFVDFKVLQQRHRGHLMMPPNRCFPQKVRMPLGMKANVVYLALSTKTGYALAYCFTISMGNIVRSATSSADMP